jgi:hypothetical protein
MKPGQAFLEGIPLGNHLNLMLSGRMWRLMSRKPPWSSRDMANG